MIERTAPENISNLTENQIFVFGSNLSGRHGKGAAKTALGWGVFVDVDKMETVSYDGTEWGGQKIINS